MADFAWSTEVGGAPLRTPAAGARPTLWPHALPAEDPNLGIRLALDHAASLCWHDPSAARHLLSDTLHRLRHAAPPAQRARGLIDAARLCLRLHDLEQAYALCLEAQPLFERMDDHWGATQVLRLRGRCCLQAGEHGLAEQLLTDAAERFTRLGDTLELARCHSLLASAYREEGHVLAAVHFAHQALQGAGPGDAALAQRLAASEALARLHLARRLNTAGDATAAQIELQAAQAVLCQMPPAPAVHPQAVFVLDVQVKLAVEAAQPKATRQHLCHLLRAARRLPHPLSQGLAWLRLAEEHARHRRWAAAIADVQRALRWLPTDGALDWPAKAWALLADLREQAGDARGAYEALAHARTQASAQERRSIAMRLALRSRHDAAELALRENEQTLAYAQRFSNVGFLVASVTHELTQPLASIRLLAENSLMLSPEKDGAEISANLRAMWQLSQRLDALCGCLVSFPVREDHPLSLQPAQSLVSLLDQALALAQSRLAQCPCSIQRPLDEALVVADGPQVVHVIANLVKNALDAMADQPDRRLSFSIRRFENHATLRVSDNGPGLASGVQERLFHPFFSTKAAGQGLGLGLALSRDAMRAMGGDLILCDDPLCSGASFELRLPSPAAPAALTSTSGALSAGSSLQLHPPTAPP